jgi:uncharacterized membrane protein
MVWFIGSTAGLIALPLLAVLGSPVLWALLPFLVAAIAAVWWALERSFRDTEILEELHLSNSTAQLKRTGPNGKVQTWEANLHWVQVIMHTNQGPVENYLTLRGGPREVEIGRFLTPDERSNLQAEIRSRLSNMK